MFTLSRRLIRSAAVVAHLLLIDGNARAACSSFLWDNPSASYPAGVQHRTFHSNSMNTEVGFNIYTPPSYSAGTGQFPTIYYLHGIGGNESTMVNNVVSWVTSRVSAGLMRPAILVFVNGAIDSAYADAKDGSRRVETSIIKELVPFVDANWRTYACREQRQISGFSMGGNGALLYASKFPELFGAVVAYAGAFLEWPALSTQASAIASCMFTNDSAYYENYIPWNWLPKNAAALSRVSPMRLIVGDQDALLATDQKMEANLSTLGIPHEFEIVPGCDHNHGCLWTTAGDRGVTFHEKSFRACGSSPLPVTPPPAGSDGGETPDGGGIGLGSEAKGCSVGSVVSSTTQSGGLGWAVVLCAVAALMSPRARRCHQRAAGGAVLGVMLGLAACTQDQSVGMTADLMPPGDSSVAPDGSPSSHVTCSAFVVNGSPTAVQGATWTYQATDDGVAYMLTGTLLQPVGSGPFPGVLVSHGFGGSATGYSRSIASVMRDWGVVGIATNYTHSVTPDGLPTGSFGASDANILRAYKTRQLLTCLPQVNPARIAAHGHSMGALITGQLLGLYPTEFTVASHSAGGVSDTGVVNDGVLTTTASVAAAIKAPYQAHHGDQDTVVPLSMDMRLDAILTAAGTKHELNIYAGYTHPQIALDTTMLDRVRTWYMRNGLF